MDNKTSGTRKLFLKPASFLSSNSDQNGSSRENGSASSPIITNPFLKCDKDESESEKLEVKNDDLDKDPGEESTTNNLFKPAKTNLFTNAISGSLSENSNFVFGQNLHERVVMENVNSTSSDHDENTNNFKDGQLFSTSKPQENVLKENAIEESPSSLTQPTSNIEVKDDEESTNPISSDNNLSLVEAARKYEEMRGAQKRKYEEVEITTGEEDERNILELNCKLFTFIANNYEERGRGILRLNDSKAGSYSRVVFRASGSLRVLLNTKVWCDQICEQPSQKSLRLTAFDTNGVIKIYLVMGRVDDMSHLQQALSSRIREEKNRTPLPEEAEAEEDKTNESSQDVEPAVKRIASE
ncbi:CLUMA_CG020679, isoform A [Clunio marinus]|uniref:CLUMA_CG020679, isoform A n=1 Tax=Clunio marinus TaxID=568069 RepID=A0A1J1J5R0_9DIPT|nr:CLUMA_CG020679, isoform A [Clunio marinus]